MCKERKHNTEVFILINSSISVNFLGKEIEESLSSFKESTDVFQHQAKFLEALKSVESLVLSCFLSGILSDGEFPVFMHSFQQGGCKRGSDGAAYGEHGQQESFFHSLSNFCENACSILFYTYGRVDRQEVR